MATASHPVDAPPASAAADSAPGLRCSVCACAVDPPLRGTPTYRKLLACSRVRVCPAHLTPGVHLLDGKRVRYCTNHHQLHDAAEFEASSGAQPSRATSQTTCTRARSLSLARIKRQRIGGAGAAEQPTPFHVVTPQPSSPFPQHAGEQVADQLLLSLPLPGEEEEEEVAEALFGWPFGEGGLSPGSAIFGTGDDDPLSFLLQPTQPLLAPPQSPGLLLEEVVGGAGGRGAQQQEPQAAQPVLHSPLVRHGRELRAFADPQQQQQQQQQLALPSVLRSPLVAAAATQLHSLATSPQMALFLRCFAGDKARSHVAVTPSAVQQYIWIRKILAATETRRTLMVTALHDRLRSLVVQARQGIVAVRGPDAACELVRVMDLVHAQATRRGALLAFLAKRTGLLSPSILLMITEFQDGNEMHLRNVATLLQLARSAAAAGDPETRSEVARLVSEFAVVQMGLVRDALAERAAWQDGLSPSGAGARFDIRQGLDGLWQSVQHSWVVIHADAFTGRSWAS